MKNSTGRLEERRVGRLLIVSEFIVSRSATGINVLVLLLGVLTSVAIILAPSPATVIIIAHVVALAAALVSGIMLSSIAGDYTNGNMLFYYMLPVSRQKIALSIILSYALLPLLSLLISLVAPVAVLVPSALTAQDTVPLVIGYTVLWTAMTTWIALVAISLRTGSGVVIALTLIYILAAPMVATPLIITLFMLGPSQQLPWIEALLLLTAIGLLAPGSSTMFTVGTSPLAQYSGLAGQALALDWAILVVLYFLAYRKLAQMEV